MIIIGHKTTIAKEFIKIAGDCQHARTSDAPLDHSHYLICSGYLAGRSIREHNGGTFERTMLANFGAIADLCDRIFAANAIARIGIIGSESGYSGSYDTAYAGAKAALHLYIETKRLTTKHQQLFGIAPTIIIDSGMTQARTDIALCEKRGAERRRGRWLQAVEVARLAWFLLCCDEGSVCNTVVRQTGGNY